MRDMKERSRGEEEEGEGIVVEEETFLGFNDDRVSGIEKDGTFATNSDWRGTTIATGSILRSEILTTRSRRRTSNTDVTRLTPGRRPRVTNQPVITIDRIHSVTHLSKGRSERERISVRCGGVVI
jgi:hypothetical protein